MALSAYIVLSVSMNSAMEPMKTHRLMAINRPPDANAPRVRDRSRVALLLVLCLSVAACAKKQATVDGASAARPVAVDAARANGREVPVVLSEPGSFIAEESSD